MRDANQNRAGLINEIESLINLYTQSIVEADPEKGERIWLVSDDVSFIHPKGHEIGWQEIKTNFYKNLMGNTFKKRDLSIYNVSIKLFDHTAIAEFYWEFNAVFMDGEPLKTEGRETQVLILNNDREWKLTHVHYSGLPLEGEREGF